ncbi:MAG TPA: nitroreductase family protein [Bacteroidales bacterium]|nr:nitroreductase family protein [Bacteroidales bacterium]
MKKPANTRVRIHPLLAERWSPRAFSHRPVSDEQLERLFEAARWAPSASNEQPWYFIVGRSGDETCQKIYDALVEFNQLWAKTAPVLVVAVSRKNSLKSGTLNTWHSYDLGQAVAHLTVQAMHEGLFVHQMGGFNSMQISEAFKIGDDYLVITIFAVGYAGDYKVLHPNLQKLELAERMRKEQKEFVFTSYFGQPLKLSK